MNTQAFGRAQARRYTAAIMPAWHRGLRTRGDPMRQARPVAVLGGKENRRDGALMLAVDPGGIEPPYRRLRSGCSTVELQVLDQFSARPCSRGNGARARLRRMTVSGRCTPEGDIIARCSLNE